MGKTTGTFLLIVALLLFLAPSATAQEMAWQKIYTGSSYVYCYDMQLTTDGGYILCGYAYSPATSWDALLIKTDANGNEQWRKIYAQAGYQHCYSVKQTPDGGYVIGGDVYLPTVGSYEVLLMKTDASGNLVWTKNLGDPALVNETCHGMDLTADGGYIICGQVGYVADAFLMKADANGDMEWMQTFGGSYYDNGRCALQTPDGGYIFCGMTYYSDATRYQAWLVKTDANGNKVWEKMYGGSGTEICESMVQTADGGYAIGGYVIVSLTTKYDFLLIKTDADGNLQWLRMPGTTDYEYGYCIEQTSDGGYILGGAGTVSGEVREGLLIKTDANGITEWQQNYGGTGYDFFESVRQTPDGGYIAAGFNDSTTPYYSGWLLKVASANQPPVADAGTDQNLAAGASCTASALLDGSASSDPDSTAGTNDDIASFDWHEGATLLGSGETMSYPFGLGSHTVTLTVTDTAGATSSDDVTITVVDSTPPVLTVPADIVVECEGPLGQAVDIGNASATDNCCPVVIGNDAPEQFFLGTTAVSWTATDCYGNLSQATQNVTVQDTIPPELSVSLTPDVLWPPNHKMIEIVPAIEASDICCSDVTVSLVSVSMDEGDVEDTYDPLFDIDPETGYIGEDIQIIDGQVFVRAERSGKSDGRIYRLTYEAADCVGNTTAVDVTVTVPHDMS